MILDETMKAIKFDYILLFEIRIRFLDMKKLSLKGGPKYPFQMLVGTLAHNLRLINLDKKYHM